MNELKKFLELYDVFEFIKDAHDGRFRKNGDLFLFHPLNVAKIAKRNGADTEEIYAALLHDTVEEEGASLEVIKNRYGQRVAFLVDGLTNLSDLGETLKKFREYSEKDCGVVRVRLCDVKHNLMTSIGPLSYKSKARYSLAIELGRKYGFNDLTNGVAAIFNKAEG